MGARRRVGSGRGCVGRTVGVVWLWVVLVLCVWSVCAVCVRAWCDQVHWLGWQKEGGEGEA